MVVIVITCLDGMWNREKIFVGKEKKLLFDALLKDTTVSFASCIDVWQQDLGSK